MIWSLDRSTNEVDFGNCTNASECETACPAATSVSNIGRLNREYMRARDCSDETV